MIALWACIAAGFAAWATWRARPRARPTSSRSPARVLLVRPVEAPFPLERLALAVPVSARQVIASPRAIDVPGTHWLWSDPQCANRKVGHLLAARSLLAEGEVFVAADADVIVNDALLADLAAAIEGGAALAFAVTRTVGGTNAAAALCSAIIDQSAMSPRAQEALSDRPAISGKVVAFSRAMLDELENVSDTLAEDLALQTRTKHFVTVATEARVLASREPTVALVVRRMERWLVALRGGRPLAFVGVPLFIAPTVPLVLAALIAGDALTTAAVTLAIGMRALLAARLVRHRLRPRPFVWVAAEAALLFAWCAAIFRMRVVWRNHTLPARAL